MEQAAFGQFGDERANRLARGPNQAGNVVVGQEMRGGDGIAGLFAID